MTIKFDVVIDTPEDAVDMKAGLDSLQGVSDATRCIAETVLTDNVPLRQSHKSKVRTTLMHTFKGSYGQVFSLDIYDDKLKAKLNRIGRSAFVELISYFLSESLYKEHNQLSEKAQRIVNDLGDKSEELIKQLRHSSLLAIHEVPQKFDHDLKVRYRKNRDDQTILAQFDQNTAQRLLAVEDAVEVDLVASITRLNINTGNGRLMIENETETVAFGFTQYKALSMRFKKVFSENLNFNNGLQDQDRKFLKLSATPIKLQDGTVIKYIVRKIYND